MHVLAWNIKVNPHHLQEVFAFEDYCFHNEITFQFDCLKGNHCLLVDTMKFEDYGAALNHLTGYIRL